MNSLNGELVMYISEYEKLHIRIRARVAKSERWLLDNCPEFGIYLITMSERSRRRLREDLCLVTEFKTWEILSGFL